MKSKINQQQHSKTEAKAKAKAKTKTDSKMNKIEKKTNKEINYLR